MPETLDQLATHENPVVRGLYNVFTTDMQQDPELKAEVWDELFAPAMEDNPNLLRVHILGVAHDVGRAAVKGALPNVAQLAERHAEVRTLSDGTKGRMTGRQFDLTINAIARRLTEQGLADEVAEVVTKLPVLKAAVVRGEFPDPPKPAA